MGPLAARGSIPSTGWRVNALGLRRAMRAAAVALGVAAFLFATAPAHAQALEPRSYANAPIGVNFLLAAYGYTEGSVAVDRSFCQ